MSCTTRLSWLQLTDFLLLFFPLAVCCSKVMPEVLVKYWQFGPNYALGDLLTLRGQLPCKEWCFGGWGYFSTPLPPNRPTVRTNSFHSTPLKYRKSKSLAALCKRKKSGVWKSQKPTTTRDFYWILKYLNCLYLLYVMHWWWGLGDGMYSVTFCAEQQR